MLIALVTAWWQTFKGKNFCEFQGFLVIREIFFCEIGSMTSFGCDTSELFSPRKSYSAEVVLS